MLLRPLSDCTPFVRSAHPYTHDGRLEETRRVGYCYAFHLGVSGTGSVRAEGRSYAIAPGSLLFIPPGIRHSFQSDSSDPLCTYNLYCDLWTDAPIQGPHLSFLPDSYDPLERTPVVPCREVPQGCDCRLLAPGSPLAVLFGDMCESWNRSGMAYREELCNSLLYGWLLRWHNERMAEAAADYRIVRLLDRLHRDEALDSAIRDCRLGRSQLYELFKRQTGLSPSQYAIRLKLEKAKRMLMETDRPVTAIAEGLGFSSVHYFSRQFTAKEGVSPRKFRERYHR